MFWLQIIWNSSTRSELLKFVDHQRASQGPDGSYDLKESHAFLYEALLKELYIGNVYLRVYNDQPDSEISEPEVFCAALVDFISFLVHNQSAAEPDLQTSGSSLEVPQHQSSMTDKASSEQQTCGDSLTSSDGKVMDKDNLGLVKNLHYGLTSLQVWTT